MEFETGDIILFEHKINKKSWKDYFFDILDGIIKGVTKSKYNHIGIIIKNPPWDEKLKGFYFLESNTEPIPDSEDHKYKFGVQLIPLDYVLQQKSKNNNLYYRKLHCSRDQEFQNKMCEIYSNVHNKPYDIDIIDWIHAAIDLPEQNSIPKSQNVHKTNTFWCSALVAYVYCKLSLLGTNIPWTVIAPSQFGSEPKHFNLTFQNCTVDKEILIKTIKNNKK